MKKVSAVLKALSAACLAVTLSGCKMARVDDHAVRVELVFPEPESFPFIKLDRLELETNDHVTYRRASGLSDAEISKLLEQGYTKEYLIYARLYLFILNTATGQFDPITQYQVFYLGIVDGYLWPRKMESYHPGKALLEFNGHDRTGPYASIYFTNAILDFSKRSTVTLKIVAIPSIGDAEARYWTTDIKRGDLGVWTDEFRQNIWPFDWSRSLPEAKITLPPWDKWHIERNPPVVEPQPPAKDVFIIIRENDNGSREYTIQSH